MTQLARRASSCLSGRGALHIFTRQRVFAYREVGFSAEKQIPSGNDNKKALSRAATMRELLIHIFIFGYAV
ncbi:MAG: hypothetical protein WCE63_05650 [Acidobacteriaceae bacterium]